MDENNEAVLKRSEHSESVPAAETGPTAPAEKEEQTVDAKLSQNTKNENTDEKLEGGTAEVQESAVIPSNSRNEADMEEFAREEKPFVADRYTLVKPIISSPAADYKQFDQLITRWRSNKQYCIFVMLKTGISEGLVRSFIMKIRDKGNAISDNDIAFIASLSILTGNDFLQKAYPTFEESHTTQTLREMMRDYYNGPTRDDRNNYEAALARADVSQRTIDELEKQLEKYQEVFLSNNETAIKREESIRADYRAMMEKSRESFEREMSLVLDQKELKIKELEEANRELKQKVSAEEENTTPPVNISILKERDDYANEVQRLKKETIEKDKRINALKTELETYQEKEKEKEIRSKVTAELERRYEEKTAKITAQKEKEIEKKDEELLQARQMINRLQEEAAPAQRDGEAREGGTGHALSEEEMQRIAEYVKDKLTEREEPPSIDLNEEDEEEILQELMEAQEIYDPSEGVIFDTSQEKMKQPTSGDTPKEPPAHTTDDILPRHTPTSAPERFRKRKSEEKPPLFFRKHWQARKETEEIEDIGFRVIASDEYSDVQKNLIQEAIDNNLSLKNLRKLANPSIPEKNMSQALHYFLRQEKNAS